MLRFLVMPPARPRQGLLAAGVALALASSLVACSDDAPSCPSGSPAILSFSVDPTSAAPGASIYATLVVDNFELGGGDAHAHAHPLAEPLHADSDAPICPGGHLHVYLDDLLTNPLVMIEATEFPIALPHDLAEGDHVLIARLQNHDHTIVKPEVTAEATITIVSP